MTDIGVYSTNFQVEDRSWLLSMWGQNPGENPNVIVDVSTFTAGTHFPNGYIPSGTHLGVITASSDATKTVVGPYDDVASDGRQTFFGFLHSSVKVPNLADLTKDVGGAAVVCGMVKLSRLPFTLDANGKADAKLFHFTA